MILDLFRCGLTREDWLRAGIMKNFLYAMNSALTEFFEKSE